MLKNSLAGMTAIPQWFCWRLWPDAARPGKYHKIPVHPDGRVEYDDTGRMKGIDAQKPYAWTTHEVATAQLSAHLGRLDGYLYTLGFMVTADCGYWFLDVDSCVQADGSLSPWAAWFYQNLPGAFFEYSSSGKGVHLVGRGCPPPGHRTRPSREWQATNPGVDLEFYTSGRGIAFGTSGQAWGSADTHLGPQTQWIAENIFTPEQSVAGVVEDGPRADWNGPRDDAELIRRALQSKSGGAMFSGKASFADLWNCNLPVLAATYPPTNEKMAYGGTEADFALASHLAFWTGCDAGRIERLMRMSRLYREKWDEHRTYLRDLTIQGACERTRNVCQDKEVVAQLAVGTTLHAGATRMQYNDMIMSCNEDQELRNEVIPLIVADRSIETLDRDFLASAVKKRFTEWGFPVSIATARQMLRFVAADELESDAGVTPEWANRHVYIMATDCFFDLMTGTAMSRTAFNAQYDRLMPQKPNGDREDSAKWCLQRWNVTTVSDTMYLPGREAIFQNEGRWYANLYNPSSIPEIATEYTPEGVKAIESFVRHLRALAGHREEVFTSLIDFMAWCVQNPGRKCRYVPLIKGMPGDGKSLLISVLRGAMGGANVGSVGAKILCSDFGDWQEGTCVTGFEELMITGKQRYAVANAIKEPITNDMLTMNRKGRPSGGSIINVTNYIAFTNFVDAVPLEDDDRRWFVIFSPFSGKTGLAKLSAALGIHAADLSAHYENIFDSLKDERRGQWRKFLLEYQVSAAFKPNSAAPLTSEKQEMTDSGVDAQEAVARQCIESGAVGVGRAVLSSSALTAAMRAICVQDGLDIPKTTSVNHMLTRMGYSQKGVVWWDGKAHRVWWKRGDVASASNDTLRSLLELTKIQHYERLQDPTR